LQLAEEQSFVRPHCAVADHELASPSRRFAGADAGHPTGRRVHSPTASPSKDITFNFSTSGHGCGRVDGGGACGPGSHPIIDDLTKQVTEATAESASSRARVAARRSHAAGQDLLRDAGVSVKPVVGGVEIAVRYITRAHEHFQLRGRFVPSGRHLLGIRQSRQPAPQARRLRAAPSATAGGRRSLGRTRQFVIPVAVRESAAADNIPMHSRENSDRLSWTLSRWWS